jgi:hypothetical protein
MSISGLEGRQPERIASVLDFEHAEKEAVHSQDDRTPDEYGNLLSLWILHPRYFQSQGDGREGKYAVWDM